MNIRFVFGCVFFLVLHSCESNLINYSSENIKIESAITTHAVDSIVLPYRAEMTKQMFEVLSYSDSSLLSYKPESPLSNLVADIIFETGKKYAQDFGICTDQAQIFSLLNFGGIRTGISRGDVTRGEIYELMPFDNAIVILEIHAEKMEDMMAYLDTMHGQPVANARFIFDDTLKNYVIGNSTEKYKSLFVITSDYLAGGGDKMNFFDEPVNRWDTGILVRDALLQYMDEKDTIYFKPVDGRMYFPQK